MRFKYDIRQLILFDECIILRIEPTVSRILNENVFGVSPEGKIIWQIEKSEHRKDDSPYTHIVRENDLLSAYNWDGFDYLVDPKTGKVISKEYIG